jgi:hypothetical protein
LVRGIVQNGEEVPEWTTFASYRASARDYDMFERWCNRFFRVAKGNGKFALLSTSKTLSEIMTVSDEGFVVAVLHNGYERWVAEAKILESDGSLESESLPPMCWSEGGATAQKRHRGWKSEGIKFFNESCREIGSLRLMRHSKELEEKFLENAKRGKNQKQMCKRRLDSDTVKPFCELEIEDEVQTGENEQEMGGSLEEQVGLTAGV